MSAIRRGNQDHGLHIWSAVGYQHINLGAYEGKIQPMLPLDHNENLGTCLGPRGGPYPSLTAYLAPVGPVWALRLSITRNHVKGT